MAKKSGILEQKSLEQRDAGAEFTGEQLMRGPTYVVRAGGFYEPEDKSFKPIIHETQLHKWVHAHVTDPMTRDEKTGLWILPEPIINLYSWFSKRYEDFAVVERKPQTALEVACDHFGYVLREVYLTPDAGRHLLNLVRSIRREHAGVVPGRVDFHKALESMLG